MPNVTEYIAANKAAKQSEESAKLAIAEATVAAYHTIQRGPNNQPQADVLENEASRTTFVNAFNGVISAKYGATINAMNEDPNIARNMIMSSVLGFTEEDVMKTVKSSGRNLTFDRFEGGLMRSLGRTHNTRYAHASNLLEGINGRDFLDQIGLDRATHPGSLTLDDKMSLVGEFEHAGVVGPTIYTGKPYM